MLGTDCRRMCTPVSYRPTSRACKVAAVAASGDRTRSGFREARLKCEVQVAVCRAFGRGVATLSRRLVKVSEELGQVPGAACKRRSPAQRKWRSVSTRVLEASASAKGGTRCRSVMLGRRDPWRHGAARLLHAARHRRLSCGAQTRPRRVAHLRTHVSCTGTDEQTLCWGGFDPRSSARPPSDEVRVVNPWHQGRWSRPRVVRRTNAAHRLRRSDFEGDHERQVVRQRVPVGNGKAPAPNQCGVAEDRQVPHVRTIVPERSQDEKVWLAMKGGKTSGGERRRVSRRMARNVPRFASASSGSQARQR